MPIKRIAIFTAFISVLFSALPEPAFAQQTPEELRQSIEAKNKELEAIAAQISQTNANIAKLQGESQTLKKQVQKYDYQISQVNLGIRASQVNIQKLTLELQSLTLQSAQIDDDIALKKEGIVETLRLLQKHDREDIIHILLKNESLVEGAFEVQAIKDLQETLAMNVNDLKSLQEELSDTITATSNKKLSLENENKNLKYRKVILDDQKQEKSQILSQVKNQETAYQKQLKELAAQQEALSQEIAAIESELRARFDTSLLPLKRAGVFQWPVTLRAAGGSGSITQHFGEISSLYRGRPHNGLDIGAPLGTPVYAATDGQILAVDYNGSRLQYGRYVLIKHPNNLTTLYAHLSRQIVSTGQSVKRGQIIGYVGSTGYATGPHLHFGVYWGPSISLKYLPPASGLVPVGVVIDPENYL